MDNETRVSLTDRIDDAAGIFRYFVLRDKTNAELHRKEGNPNVRFSPITIASERVFGWLQRLAIEEGIELPPVVGPGDYGRILSDDPEDVGRKV